jgi:hypothetical protein
VFLFDKQDGTIRLLQRRSAVTAVALRCAARAR